MNNKIKIIIMVLILIIVGYLGYNKYVILDNNKTIKNQTISSLDLADFKQELEAGDKVLIDIRTQEELDRFGKIEGDTLYIDFYDSNFSKDLDKLDKSKKYLIYCYHGNRSKGALDIMKNLGFNYVKDLNGGIDTRIKNGNKVFK